MNETAMTTPTKKYIEVHAEHKDGEMLYVPKGGVMNVVELPDMSYYRCRSPSEKPIGIYQNTTVMFELKGGGLYMGWFDEFDECDGITFCSGDEGYIADDIKWWAYAYIPSDKGAK